MTDTTTTPWQVRESSSGRRRVHVLERDGSPYRVTVEATLQPAGYRMTLWRTFLPGRSPFVVCWWKDLRGTLEDALEEGAALEAEKRTALELRQRWDAELEAEAREEAKLRELVHAAIPEEETPQGPHDLSLPEEDGPYDGPVCMACGRPDPENACRCYV